MRRLDSTIPAGHQRLTRVTKRCVRECVSKYRVFDSSFPHQKHFRTESLVNDQRKIRESQNSVLTCLFDVSAFGICRLNDNERSL